MEERLQECHLWDLNSGSMFKSLDTGKRYWVQRMELRMVEVERVDDGKKFCWPNHSKVKLVEMGKGSCFGGAEA
jgi:hypothetical protein